MDPVIVPDRVVMSEHTEAYKWGPFPFPPECRSPSRSVLAAIAGATFAWVRDRDPDRAAAPRGRCWRRRRPRSTCCPRALRAGRRRRLAREEFEAAGLDFALARAAPRRHDRRVPRALEGLTRVTFSSKTVSFEKIWCEPRPVQRDGIPVWFSGTLHKRNVERIVALGRRLDPDHDRNARRRRRRRGAAR